MAFLQAPLTHVYRTYVKLFFGNTIILFSRRFLATFRSSLISNWQMSVDMNGGYIFPPDLTARPDIAVWNSLLKHVFSCPLRLS